MTVHPARILAGLALAAGGSVVGVAALAVVLAKVLVDAGAPVHPGDIATLNDVLAVIPFVGAFAAASLVAAAGLLTGQAWGERAGVASAVVAVAVGVTGLLLIVVGRDPFASGDAAKSFSDGLGIVGAFTVLHLVVLAALAVARVPSRQIPGVPA